MAFVKIQFSPSCRSKTSKVSGELAAAIAGGEAGAWAVGGRAWVAVHVVIVPRIRS